MAYICGFYLWGDAMPRTDLDQVFRDGVLISTIERIVSDEQIEQEQTREQARLAVARLVTIATGAEQLANQSGNLTQAQLKQLAGAVGDIARILRGLIRAVL